MVAVTDAALMVPGPRSGLSVALRWLLFAILGLFLTLVLIRNADSRASTQEAALHEAGTAVEAAA